MPGDRRTQHEQRMDFSGWYHMGCTCAMMEDMGVAIPARIMQWAQQQVFCYRLRSPDVKRESPMMALVVLYGIYYGIRSRLERAFVAYPALITHESIEHVARRMVIAEATRTFSRKVLVLPGVLHGITEDTAETYSFGNVSATVSVRQLGSNGHMIIAQIDDNYFDDKVVEFS